MIPTKFLYTPSNQMPYIDNKKIPKKCILITDDKYTNRPSLPFYANDCLEIIMKGNDNKLYISKEDKNRIY